MTASSLYNVKRAKDFKKFRAELYKGDTNYVSTSEFVLDSLLFKQTEFACRCATEIATLCEDETVLAQALFIYNPRLPYLQVAFFDALENVQDAVNALLRLADERAVHYGAKRVVIGLHGHLSYGVGILTDGFDYVNSFDSLYNKPYYAEYFKEFECVTLSTYRAEKNRLEEILERKRSRASDKISIRYADMSHFAEETEIMRRLCEQTISKTYLWFPTDEGHFFELMKDMKPFLGCKNLIFALDGDGREIGFLFWHPDYNRMLRTGRVCSMAEIAASYVFKRSRIDTAKLNAVGSLSYAATLALIEEFSFITGKKFKYVETNFVWDNNLPSRRLNEHFFGAAHRKYGVYFTDGNKKG